MSDGYDPWAVWFEKHGAALVLLARQWVSSRNDAEDIVQEAFIRFWRSRDQVSEPVGYLYTCVKHCALDWQRRRQRQLCREIAAARPEAETLFSSALEHNERRLAIEAAICRLPENQAEVLVMRIWGGLTFPQVAAALSTSENTAASRYRYALTKLREQLAEELML